MPVNPGIAAATTVSGSVAVYYSPSGPTVAVSGITNSINVYLGGTAGTIGVRAGQVDGTVAIYFSPANPVMNPSVAYNSGVVGGTTQRIVHVTDVGASMRLMSNSGVDIGDVDILSIAAGNNNIGDVDIASGTLTGITNSISVYLSGTAGTLGVRVGQVDGTVAIYFSPANPAVNPSVAYNSGVVGSTTQRVVQAVDVGSSVRLMSNSGVDVGDVDVLTLPALVAGTANIGDVDIVSGTLTSITNTIAVYFDRANPAVSANYGSGTFNVAFSPSGPQIGGITNSIAVYFQGSNPKVNLGTDVLNISATAIIPQTASGSTSTAGNTTVVSPEASRNIKVYAFSLTTTAQVGISPRWTTGASAGATERWRVALQAPSQGIAGANLAVTPPAYLFAMGSNVTLALYLDAGSLVHYSVAYFKESA